MRRPPPPSLQFLAAAATDATAAMSSRPYYRGGRNQWPRASSSSNRRFYGGRGQYVTGESHFRSVGDANLGIRQGDAAGIFPNSTGFSIPPPNFNQNQHFRRAPTFDSNQHYRQNQKFGPPPQQYRPPPQQSRPRPKPLDYRNWEYAKMKPPTTCALFQLQEVDRFQDLEEELKLKGYSGIWKMRTGNPVDGCAIFWRSSRFKMIHEECIEFSKLGLRDNVAQICVLESTYQNSTKEMTGPPTSSKGSNKVVICNIHVLYNPKRGEIKLGQVRVLLDRAHAVSKIWNDAPIVYCGDFNCTPKSPLYNFISEQQLDLSGVDRDKVSGQASAQIYAQESYNPNHGALPANHFAVGGREAETKPTDSTLDRQNTNNPESTLENVLLANDWSQPHFAKKLSVFDKSSTNVRSKKDGGAQDVEVKKETKNNAIDVSVVETESDFHVLGDGLEEDVSTSYGKQGFPVDILSNENHRCSPPVSPHVQQAYSDVTELGFKEKEDFTSNSNPGLSCGHQDSNLFIGKEGKDLDINKRLSTRDNDSVREGIDEVDLELQKSLENLSLAELDEAIREDGNLAKDDNTFISALHSTEDDFPSDLAYAFSNSALSASTNVVEDGSSPRLDSEFVNMERTYYDRSLWTPMEIETATGNAECTLLQHPLNLRSTYTEVEDCTGARDSNGEPQVTSYNRLFLGTVDYIWRSEGLQTVRVLAPIPKDVMQLTSGFPTKKWGSDHIALASELAFINSSDRES